MSPSATKLAYATPSGSYLFGDDGTFDSFGNLATANHLYAHGAVPAISATSCAVGNAATNNDVHGTFSLSATATVTVTFAKAYANAPDCQTVAQSGAAPSYSTSKTALTVNAAASSQTFTHQSTEK